MTGNSRNQFASALVMVSFLLAGCADDAGPAQEDEPTDAATGGDQFDSATGAIIGGVFNVEGLPVTDAELLLHPLGATTNSSADGTYAFSFIEPGEYTVAATRVGFEPASQRVRVNAGLASPLDLTLTETAVAQPRVDVLGPLNGYFQCRWSGVGQGPCAYVLLCESGTCADTQQVSDAVWKNDQLYVTFELDGEDWQEILFEARWTAATLATNPRMSIYFSHAERDDVHIFGRSPPGESPLAWNYTKDAPHPDQRGGDPQLPEVGAPLVAWVSMGHNFTVGELYPPSVAYEVRFEITISVFYSQRAPEGYSAYETE